MSNATLSKLVVLTAAVALAGACGGNSGGTSSTTPPPSNPSLTPAASDQTEVAAIISAAFIAGLQQVIPAFLPSGPSSPTGARMNTHLFQQAETLADPAQTGSVEITYGLVSLPTSTITETIPLTGSGVVQLGQIGSCTFSESGNVVITWTPGVGGTATATENLQTTLLNCPAPSSGPSVMLPQTYFQSWGIPVTGLKMTCSLAIAGDGAVQPDQVCTLSGSITFYNPNPCASNDPSEPLCSFYATELVSLTYTYSDFPSQPPTVSGQMGTSVNGTLPSVAVPTAMFTSPPSPLTIFLSPPMDVQSCVPGSASGESINLENVQPDSSGNINSTWYVQNGAMTPIIQVTGNVTPSAFSVNLSCLNGGGSGSISATGNNYNFNGTYTLNTP